MTTRIIGIDLGVTAAHKAVVLDPATDTYLGRPRSFRTRPHELDRIWRWAQRDAPTPVEVIVICEATGMAWYPICVYFQRRGAQVYRIDGGITRAMRGVLKRHAGSDRVDSRVLARLCTVIQQRLVPWYEPSGDQLALQRACREANRWRERDVAIQNRLTSYDQWAWRGLKKLIPAAAWDWMRQTWYDQLAAAWQAAAPTRPADVDWITRWIARAEERTTLFGSRERVGYADLQADMQRGIAQRDHARQAQAAVTRTRILPLYRQLYPDSHLESIPGVGAASAATYMAFIQDIARFPSAARFRSWCGMIPRSHQSGDFQAKQMGLTQAGPNLVKATLYLNVDVARQWDVQMAAFYYRQMVAYGKHHTQAVCACANHLAARIYAVLTQQRPYELRDPKKRPISKAASRELCLTTYKVPEEVRRRTRVRDRKARTQQRVEQRFQPHRT